MLVYRFPFRPEAAGQAIQIHRSDGTVVDSGVVPSEVDVTGVVAYEAELPEGNYYVTGATPGWDGVSGPVGVLDVPSSIEAGGGGSTTETAKFIGTATGDTSGDQFELTFVADGDVDWARVVDGRIECDGPIVVDMMYRYVAQLDFTDAAGFSTVAQSPDTDVTVKLARVPGEEPGAVNAGGPYSFIPTGTPGTVFDIDAVEAGITQSTRAAANDLLTIKATINAQGYDAESGPVTDGVLTGALAITITSLPLPDAPTLP